MGKEEGWAIKHQFALQPEGRWREMSENLCLPGRRLPTAKDEGSSEDIAGQGAARRNPEQQLLPAEVSCTSEV